VAFCVSPTKLWLVGGGPPPLVEALKQTCFFSRKRDTFGVPVAPPFWVCCFCVCGGGGFNNPTSGLVRLKAFHTLGHDTASPSPFATLSKWRKPRYSGLWGGVLGGGLGGFCPFSGLREWGAFFFFLNKQQQPPPGSIRFGHFFLGRHCPGTLLDPHC